MILNEKERSGQYGRRAPFVVEKTDNQQVKLGDVFSIVSTNVVPW